MLLPSGSIKAAISAIDMYTTFNTVIFGYCVNSMSKSCFRPVIKLRIDCVSGNQWITRVCREGLCCSREGGIASWRLGATAGSSDFYEFYLSFLIAASTHPTGLQSSMSRPPTLNGTESLRQLLGEVRRSFVVVAWLLISRWPNAFDDSYWQTFQINLLCYTEGKGSWTRRTHRAVFVIEEPYPSS